MLERSEVYLRERNLRLGRSWEDNKLTELARDNELRNAVGEQHREFQAAALQLLETIAVYIRRNPDEFVRFVD
ncbi:hypothetical protein D3C71_1799910 [compost metagenome]